MVFNPNPTIQSFETAVEFVEYLLYKDASATTLIVCSTRDVFIHQLCASIAAPTSGTQQHPDAFSQGDHEGNRSHLLSSPGLYKTIGAIAASQRITLEFCPSLEHFRAYLSTFSSRRPGSSSKHADALRNQSMPALAVLGLVALHYDTREFSAQGIAQSLALTVEIAARENVNLTLCESTVVGQEDSSGSRLWNVDVPLLSGQTRATGTGGESAHAGRTVKVKQVAKRWFDFV
ncbi:hypothetical protein GX48_06074 [Paracoccidioides brasiliensis]|nr:hypothetical protein GX48_06074 [Paracoccidioides brasiliensis]